MAYTSSGRLPIERASKLGHIKIIEEPRIQRLLEVFESTSDIGKPTFGEVSGRLDLASSGELENVVAVDGSQACIPNVILNHKRIGFVTVAAVFLQRSEIKALKENPIVDPRVLARKMEENTKTLAAAVPLGGLVVPGESVITTLRNTIDEIFRYTGLYKTLQFLVSREWLHEYGMEEHMDCISCGESFQLPRSTLAFECPSCKTRHTLSDYLQLVAAAPEDWAKEEVVISLRNVLETLLLFSFIVLYKDRPTVLRRTLFIKDGPLLLRAHLSRLVQPIREFITFLTENDRKLHLVGIEKTGDLVDHLPFIRDVLVEPGDYFLPSVRYLHEQIQGVPFAEEVYRNRVQYGNKIVVRLGQDHTLAANVPTGEFKVSPSLSDLLGVEESMGLLAELTSYSYENALIPLVLANRVASISMSPSGDILEAFARRVLGD